MSFVTASASLQTVARCVPRLAQSASAPRLVRPPSADLFVPRAFEHGATVKRSAHRSYAHAAHDA